MAASICTRSVISALQQGFDPARKHTLHRLQCRTGAGLRAGSDEVGDGFGLRQVQLAVEKGTFGEFAGSCQPRAKLADTTEQRIEQHRAAVSLQFQHVLAGVGGRIREVQQQAAIDQRTVRMAESARSGRNAVCGGRPSSACAISGTAGPETRTTPTPAAPAALAMAAMVSRVASDMA